MAIEPGPQATQRPELTQFEERVSNLNDEIDTLVNYVREHQSRLAKQEERLHQLEQRSFRVEQRADWLDHSVRNILHSRAWRFYGMLGRLSRKLFRRR